jgi:CBS domain-containing protein
MGTLLPNYGNVTFSGAGVLSPLHKDPNYETIGIGTRIFLGGAQGYITWEGTQHNPSKSLGTIMVIGNLKEMSPRYLRGCTIHRYGTSLYVGLGIPIPILNTEIARAAATGEEQIKTQLLDYGVPRRDRPVIRDVTYAELRSGKVEIKGKEIPVSPLSSFKIAREIAEKLKEWIEKGEFFLSPPVELLSRDTAFKPMKQVTKAPLVKDVMTKPAITALPEDSISHAAKILAEKAFNHLPIVDNSGRLLGIVTSWDLAVALGRGKEKLSEIMTQKVVTASEDEPVDSAARKLELHNISGLPVIDQSGLVKGVITSEDISKLIGRGKR